MPIITWPDKGSACLEVRVGEGRLGKRNDHTTGSFFSKRGLILVFEGAA